jgi:hypothetical protein
LRKIEEFNMARNRTDDDDDPNSPFDRNGVLKDGRSVRVPTHLRDGRSVVSVGNNSLTDAQRVALSSCRPGYRFVADATTRNERKAWADDAYAEVEHRNANAWRNPSKGLGARGQNNDSNGNGRFGSQGNEGDSCTVRGEQYPDYFGAPGTLQRRGGKMVCVPNDADEDDADEVFGDRDTLSDRDLAYRDYARELRGAWRRG